MAGFNPNMATAPPLRANMATASPQRLKSELSFGEGKSPLRMILEGLWNLPQRALEGAAQYQPGSGDVANMDATVGPVADAAMATAGGAMFGAPMRNGLGMGIRAYHGSPHDFEAFDSGKIGTGEGAQAYGHGLYFSEHPNVAEEYKRALVNPDKMTINGVQVDNPNSVELGLSRYQGNVPKFITAMEPRLAEAQAKMASASAVDEGLGISERDIAKMEVDRIHKLIADAKTYEGKTFGKAGAGRTYEVDINAHPDEFLDWDKPLSEQSPAIQEKLTAGGINPNHQPLEPIINKGPNGWMVFQRHSVGGKPQVTGNLGPFKRQADAQAAAASIPARPKRIVSDMAFDPNDTAKLKAAGIKGIRYKDAGSRVDPAELKTWRAAAADYKARGLTDKLRVAEQHVTRLENEAGRTHNFVVFDAKNIAILKKYGLAGLTGGLGAAAAANMATRPPSGGT